LIITIGDVKNKNKEALFSQGGVFLSAYIIKDDKLSPLQ